MPENKLLERAKDLGGSARDALVRAAKPENLRATDAWLARYGAAVLAVFALFYYSQYYRSELNLGGEGGTTAVIAMRLMEGLRPFVDTYLGYNVMWFYPVVALFEVTGPDFVALRLYFFAICAMTGLFGFLVVRRVTGVGWLAVGTGILLLMVPGMIFRNYMGMLPVMNTWVILNAFVLEQPRRGARLAWMGAAGIALGLTYLVRIDLGHFFLVIYAGAIALYPLGVRGAFLGRLPAAAGAAILLAAGLAATHVPVWLDARSRGFDVEFVDQYRNQIRYMRYEIETKILGRGASAIPLPPQNRAVADAAPGAPDSGRGGPTWIRVRSEAGPPAAVEDGDALEAEDAAAVEIDRHTRPRATLGELFEQESFYDAAFVVALHGPLLISGIIVFVGGCALLVAVVRGDAGLKRASLSCLVATGAALTLFPQYFFFRPDTPHLSEFMCPFLVAIVCASYFAFRWMGSTRALVVRAGCAGFIALCATDYALYFYHSYPKESAGTIAAKRKRSHEFVADNGVRVFVKRREREDLQGLFEAVVNHSGPDDWVITYPYSPTINFMANRRSYLHNLYVDNATAHREFPRIAREEIEKFQPAVIVVDDRPINNTDYSRFSNWASETLEFIRSSYVHVGTFKTNAVYVRPDKIRQEL